MPLFEKITKEQKHLYKYYDVLNWGEDLDSFLDENIKLYQDYQGKFFQFVKNNQKIGGLFFYFNPLTNSNAIGCAAIDPKYRGKGYYKKIINKFIKLYPKLYLFCQPHLIPLYSKFFKYQKHITHLNVYLFSNYEITIEDKGPFF